MDPSETDTAEMDPAEIAPVELEPVELEPVELEPVELEPVDPGPAVPAPGPVSSDPDPATKDTAWQLELRGADGRLRGLFDLPALRAMIYTRQIDPKCKVRHLPPQRAWPLPAGQKPGPWQPLSGVPALVGVMELLGLELGDEDAERRIAGWRKSGAHADDDPVTVSTEVSQIARAVAPPAPGERLPVHWLILGTLLLVLVFMLIGLVLS
ncbi:MAG: hypothetical protein GXP62_09165 [Oligoflexia bacterium]|nr:hypothetical protein [Oligoflexia bacterium]